MLVVSQTVCLPSSPFPPSYIPSLPSARAHQIQTFYSYPPHPISPPHFQYATTSLSPRFTPLSTRAPIQSPPCIAPRRKFSDHLSDGRTDQGGRLHRGWAGACQNREHPVRCERWGWLGGGCMGAGGLSGWEEWTGGRVRCRRLRLGGLWSKSKSRAGGE